MKKGFSFIFLLFAIVFSLPIGFMLTSPANEGMPFFGVLIFIAVDLMLWAVFFSGIVKSIKHKKIAKKGTEFTAKFVSYASNVAVNNVPMFYISYTWQNEYGEQKEGKSASDYTIHEAEAFEKAKKFKIKVLKNDSIIVTKASELIAKLKDGSITDGKICCEYW